MAAGDSASAQESPSPRCSWEKTSWEPGQATLPWARRRLGMQGVGSPGAHTWATPSLRP